MGDSVSLNHDSSTIVSHRCREFESALRDGSRPTIEGFLVDTEDEDRAQLVAALVAVEIRFRLQCGESPQLPEYLERFPDYTAVLGKTVPSLLDEQGDKLVSTLIAQPVGVKNDVQEDFTSTQQLGRYQLEATLGRGGFGEVWRAFDPILRRKVAVKTLRRDRELSADALEAFLNEGRHLAQLKHPGIVSIYDVGVDRGRAFIVSELVDGSTLQKQLEDRKFSWQAAALVVAQIADGLQAAHESNIFHRDIKPSNILIDHDGAPHIADFGLAVTEEQQMDESMSTLGTFGYMPPEQVSGQSQLADGRADIYSLGVILYRLLTDRLPFVAKTVEQYRTQVLHRAPRPLRSIVPSLPEELERVCLKCLAKSPENRFLTAADLAHELRRIVAAHEPRPATLASPPVPAVRSRWPTLGVAGVVIAAAAIAIPLLRNQGAVNFDLPQEPPALQNVGQFNDAPHDPAALTVSAMSFTPPEREGAPTWDVLRDGQSIRVTSGTLNGLVQLGHYTGGTMSFDIEIEPIGSITSAGLFVGHQSYGDEGDQVRFLLVEIQNWLQPHQRLIAHMPQYSVRDESLGGDAYVGNVDVPMGPLETTKTIGITLQEGRLVEVRVNGERVEGIPNRWDEFIAPGVDLYGPFGLTCTLGAATFRDPLLNEVEAHFRVGTGNVEAEEPATDEP